MLNYIFQLMQEYNIPGWRLFGYTSFRALLTIVLALLISSIFGEYFIRYFKKKQISETLRDLDKTNLKVGQKVKVIVTTSADVDYLLVNGQKITKYTGGYLFRIWTVTITATSAGTMEIETVAYNRDDAASDPITVTVNVRKSGGFW